MEINVWSLLGYITLFFFAYLFEVFVRRQLYAKWTYTRQGLPSEKFAPVIGNLKELMKYKQQDKQMLFQFDLMNKYKQLGHDTFLFFFGPNPRILSQDPVFIKSLLRTQASHYAKSNTAIQVLHPFIGKDSLLLSSGETWRSHRKLLTPIFHRTNLKSMTHVMSDCVGRMAQEWCEDMGKKITNATIKSYGKSYAVFDVHRAMTHLTLDLLSSTVFGSSILQDAELASVLFDTCQTCLYTSLRRAMNPMSHIPLLKLIPTADTKAMDSGSKRLRELCLRIIRERSSGKTKSILAKRDILDLLIEAAGQSDAVNERQIMEQTLTFFFAGHETTSNALTFTTWLLCRHPEVQDKVFNEIKEVLNGQAPDTFDKVQGLEYLDAVLLESMRLYPPAPHVLRIAKEDNVLDASNGKKIKILKGTEVGINTYCLHRNPDHWPDPERFDPTRWLNSKEDGKHQEEEEEKQKQVPFTYLPFGGGSRVCIGREFAMTEAKIVLAMMCHRFRFVEDPGHCENLTASVTMNFSHGCQAHITTRE